MPDLLKNPFTRIYFPVLVGNFLATLNIGAISVAMPFLAQAAGIAPEQALALPVSYLIGLVAATVLSGYLVQRFGERTILSIAIVGFVVANILAFVFVANFLLLVPLVFFQGVCAGPIPPITQRSIAMNFPEEKRAPRMALWQGGLTLGAVTGSVGGGFLLSRFGPEWVFAMAPATGLVALAIVLSLSPNDRNANVRFDVRSFILLLVVVMSLTTLLEFGNHLGWFRSPISLGLLASTVVGGLLLKRALNRDTGRLLDLSVLHNRDLAVGIAMVLIFFSINTGHLQTQMLVWVYGFGPDAIAERLGYGGPLRLLGIFVCGLLTVRFSTRSVMIASLLIVMSGKLGYLLWTPAITQLDAVLPFGIHSFGAGMLMVCIATMAYKTLSKGQMASAAILYVLAQRLGGSVGLGALGAAEAVFQSSLEGAAFTAAQAQGAAFLGVSWIEFMAVIPLVLGVYLFSAVTQKQQEVPIQHSLGENR